jgi:hypothetical protein
VACEHVFGGERSITVRRILRVPASTSPIGSHGRVTASGAIRPGRVGEVMVAIRGGVEAFLARDADGGAIEPYEEVAVVDYEPPRTVVVTRLYEQEESA